MTTSGPSGRWVVLLAVKPLPLAKSRLARPDRSALTLAMAADTVAAAADVDAVDAVLVVCDDPDARALLSPLAVVIADAPAAGLNPALSHAAAVAATRWPGRGVAALAADLPALRPHELKAALALAGTYPRTVVADASGVGTVMLTAVPAVELAPAFGPDSRSRHLRDAVDLTDVLASGDATSGLRHDVDTSADLEAAIRIGVGPATARVLSGNVEFTLEWHTAPVTYAGMAAEQRRRV